MATLLAPAVLLGACRQGKQDATPSARTPIVARDPGLLPITRPSSAELEKSAAEVTRREEERLERTLAEPGPAGPRLAAAYGELGKAYHAFGLYRLTLPCYQNAIRLDPDAFAWPYLLARAHAQLGETQETAAALDQALALEPRSVPALMLRAETERKAERIADATATYERILQISPGLPAAAYALGQIEILTGDARSGVRRLEEVVAKHPQAGRVHYLLAMAYRQLGDEARARGHMDQRGQGTPPAVPDPLMESVVGKDSQAVARRGTAALSSGAYLRAVELLRAARDGMPEDADLRLQLGAALASAGDPESALAEYAEALRLRPDDPRVMYFMGMAQSAMGRDREALESMRRAVQRHPDYAQAQAGLAQALRRMGRHGEALAPLEAAVRLDPSNVDSRLERAQLLARLGRCAEAVEGADAGRAAFPADPRFTVLLARLLAACPDTGARDPARAVSLAREAFARGATVETAATVALAHAANGQWAEAVAWQRRAITMVPVERPGIRAALGQRLTAYGEKRAPAVEW